MVLLSGSKYVIISLIYLAISRLISEIQLNNESLITEIEGKLDNDDEINLFETIKKVIEDNEDFIEISNENSKNKNNVDISKPLNFQNRNYIKEIKQTIYENEEEAIKEVIIIKIEGSEDNDEVYEKRISILDNIYAKPNELSKNKNELDNYLSLEEEGKDTDPFD
ncbi:17032_t:CDS:2 [Funneliformis caledonium]|uniref:17032_t:CDS:1 n=1 Tax=Funneliformis caledonium TaxID=1117310 RepID=A0A9N9I8X1_9GLOM|nr:17032_t:CDS:2 [Funneliformis caledonium]